MEQPDSEELNIRILDVGVGQPIEGQQGEPIILRTTRGDIGCLFHNVPGDDRAVLWVWGARGGVDGPADGIYGLLAEELTSQGIASLRLDYRQPGVLHESVMDTLAGVSFLKGTGHEKIALVGHSFGGAVVIAAAPFSPQVVAVASLSSQTYGAQNAAEVSPKPLLLLHGANDMRLSFTCSETIYQWAQEPKEIRLFPGAGHGLQECKEELHQLLGQWLAEKLGAS